jgi:hypothetical protein
MSMSYWLVIEHELLVGDRAILQGGGEHIHIHAELPGVVRVLCGQAVAGNGRLCGVDRAQAVLQGVQRRTGHRHIEGVESDRAIPLLCI